MWCRSLRILLSLCVLSTFAEAKGPNVVLIFSDDQGVNDLGCYGSEFATPHLDRLATEGMRFTQWYSASSICTPSRYGLLTGRNPSRSKDQLLSALMFMGDKDLGIHPEETTVATRLKGVGYDTALIGKWHLGHGDTGFLPTRHGFDRFIGHTGGCIDFFTMTYGILPDWYHQEEHVSENGYATELITDEAVRYLRERRGEEAPFFLYLAYNAPHFGKGYSPSKGEPVNLMQPQAAELKRVTFIEDKIRREFAAMTLSMDDGIGRVLATLKQEGLEEDTLVIFLTDHGGDPTYGGSNLPLRGDKATLFEGGIRVPCMMRWPGRIPAGSTSDAILSSLDLAPTFCALAGVNATGESFDGTDLQPIWRGGAGDSDRRLFWELGSHAELERGSWYAIREGEWKYIQTPDQGEFLFRLSEDPNEVTNLAEQESGTLEHYRELSQQLAQQMRQ